MPVDDAALGNALCEQRGTARNELGGKTLYLADGPMRDHGVRIALQLLQVLLPASSDRTSGAMARDPRLGSTWRCIFVGRRVQ